MVTRFRSWWQYISKYWVVPITIALTAAVVIILLGYWLNWDWTGFNAQTGPSLKLYYYPAKTLWDWMQLLIIPIVLAIAGFWLNQIQKSREQRTTEQQAENERRAAEQRARSEREIASDNQREAALQGYLDKMSELLFERKLRESKPEDEVRTIARARTLTVLRRLDADRKGNLVQFLQESGLIQKTAGGSIIDMGEADLSGANLLEVHLRDSNLSGADLRGADLRKANLYRADLIMCNLCEAKLSGAYLNGANLSEADLSRAIMGEVYLNRTYLSNANLSGAKLNYGKMNEADLSKAGLQGSDLSGVDLQDALLDGADLSRAIVTSEQLKKAKSLQGTTMPDGTKHP
jgi:uncharacterized protein YjbI with pentapeptide repeats